MLVSVKAGAEEDFSIFSKKNAPLLRKYDIELFKALAIKVKGQLVGQNDVPQPDFISVFKIPSMPRFVEYMSDPEYKEASDLRALCTTSVIGYFTNELPLPVTPNLSSQLINRMYVVGLANFKEGDSDGIEEFNKQAIQKGLFEKHGMHIELQLQPFKVATVVGDAKVETPDRVQLFFVDNPENLKQYISDPLYKELSPIRDSTLLKYDFFGGSVK